MALVNTQVDNGTIADKLRGAMADELGATNLYSGIHRDILASELSEDLKKELADRIKEIIADEEQHLGSLLYCIALSGQDPEFDNNMKKGVDGK